MIARSLQRRRRRRPAVAGGRSSVLLRRRSPVSGLRRRSPVARLRSVVPRLRSAILLRRRSPVSGLRSAVPRPRSAVSRLRWRSAVPWSGSAVPGLRSAVPWSRSAVSRRGSAVPRLRGSAIPRSAVPCRKAAVSMLRCLCPQVRYPGLERRIRSPRTCKIECVHLMTDVIVKRIGSAALVQLNRPKALNALNVGMIETLTSAYQGFVRDGVKLIVLEGAGGKAFCAGGDVRAIWEDKSGATGRDFFVKEYRLNYLIGSLSIPHVALIHGIVMGGGAGVSVHGKYRVATEKTVFAMPETAIGLFPDVGGSIFLPRLPGQLGAYLGLTGARLKGYETVSAGIATHYVSSDRLEQLKEALLARGVAALDEFGERHSDEAMAILRRGVDRAFAHNSVEEIVAALERDPSPWARETLDTLRKVSPTSLKVTLRMLREAPPDREGCFRLEHRLSSRFLKRKDFFEGVRALLVDKTNDAKWSPPSLADVDTDYYFKPDAQDKVLSLL